MMAVVFVNFTPTTSQTIGSILDTGKRRRYLLLAGQAAQMSIYVD